MEIQTRVAPAELWLRDDLENIYALLFRFLGFGFRLAMSNVGWHVTQKFVILVPDPIAFAPRISQDSHVPWSSRGGTRVHQALLRGRWRSWRRASRQGQPCSCLFFKTHQIGLLLCFCAEPQSSGEVDQDPEGGLTRQRNARPSFLIMCCGGGFFTERTCEPSRARSAARWPNTSPSSSWKSSPTWNMSIWTPAHRCSAALIRAHCSRTERRQPATSNRWLALHRLERGGAA